MSTRRLSILGVVTVLALTSAALGLITPVAPADQSTGVTTPWATAAQPAGNGWSLNVFDSATLPSTVTVAVAQLHIWGQPPGPESLVSAADSLYSAEFPVTGLQPGRYVASVSWTPLTLRVPTSWSPPVSFTVGGAVCARPPVAVNLPGVDVSYSTHTTKPWGVRYLPLGLSFTPTSPASSSSCSLLATGTLNVQIGLQLVQNQPQITIPVDSVATAELDFLRPDATAGIQTCDWVTVKLDCSLDGVSGTVVRWHTEGFSEQIQVSPGNWVQVFNSGPLTFYDSVDPGLSFSQQVQTAETAFHLDLIAHLQDINPVYLIQEPPANLSVTDSAGRTTGITGNGKAADEIPGSVYVKGKSGYSAVVLLSPSGPYTATASGPEHSSYSLVMDELRRGGRFGSGDEESQTTGGQLPQSGRASACLPTDSGLCPRSVARLQTRVEYRGGQTFVP